MVPSPQSSVVVLDLNNNVVETDCFGDKADAFSRQTSTTSTASTSTCDDEEDEFAQVRNRALLAVWECLRTVRGLGVFFSLAAVICWSAMSATYRIAKSRLEPLALMTVSSLLVALIYLAVIVLFYRQPARRKSSADQTQDFRTLNSRSSGREWVFRWSLLLGPRHERLHLLSRCLLGTFSMAALFSSLKYIPLADATTIRFTSPVFIAVFAHFLVDEPFGLLQAVNCFITLTGVVLIGHPSFVFDLFAHPGALAREALPVFEGDKLVGFVLALVSAVTISLSMISMRKLRATPAALVIFWFSLLSSLVSATLLVTFQGLPDLSVFTLDRTIIVFIVVTVVVSSLDLLFITLALKLERASAVAVIQALCVVLSFVLSITLVGERIDHVSAIGGGLIFLSVVILAGAKWVSEVKQYSDFAGSRSSISTTETSASLYETNLKTYIAHSAQNDKMMVLTNRPLFQREVSLEVDGSLAALKLEPVTLLRVQRL